MNYSDSTLTSASAREAHRVFAAAKYYHKAHETCYEKCVVDFQTADIAAFEKECANACINKHVAFFKDVNSRQE